MASPPAPAGRASALVVEVRGRERPGSDRTRATTQEDVVRRSLSALSLAIALVAALVPQFTPVASAGNGKGKVWRNAPLPFSTTFKIPKGVSMVKASAKAGGSVSVSLTNADTGRPRCYPVIVKTWSSNHTGEGSCDALTAVDRPGATWRMDVSADSNSATEVRLQFVTGSRSGTGIKTQSEQAQHAQVQDGSRRKTSCSRASTARCSTRRSPVR